MDNQPLYTNRLKEEKSPYLLQHAHNPVDWYPWSEEAFNAAKLNDKPIFLSIGYATCHWCHVMERESFEDLEVAQLLNQVFICIKVDREELPDVDSLYMEFAQSMMAGAAGWPLNVILTPNLEPFFAFTYLPPHSAQGLLGLIDLIQRISQLWQSEERERILDEAEKIVDVFSETVHVKGEEYPELADAEETIDLLFKAADPVYGGLSGAPKFPIGYQYSLMLLAYLTFEDVRALFFAEKTLDMMHRGGIYDHLGGGFSRYSVDEKWLIPHFEKMLYDNAILAKSYLEAWQVTHKPLYKKVCCEILDYVLRDMTHPEGGFYSAEDADSEGHEGFFYTWHYDEINAILGPDSNLFCEYYGITPEGNFEGRTILNTPLSLEIFASEVNLSVEELEQQFDKQRKRLWEVREKRVHPLKDDKILCSWNGLMIHALAEAAFALDRPEYQKAAIKAAQFIKKNLWVNQHLLRRWRDNQAMYVASLDEYAFLIRGLISLFEGNAGTEWLQWAIELTAILQLEFKEFEGAFYQTDGIDKNLILRKCHFSDGSEPSGNAIHTENLLRLYEITANMDYLDQAEDVLRAVLDPLDHYPTGYCYHVINLFRYYHLKCPKIIIALNSKREHEDQIKEILFKKFVPFRSIIWQSGDLDLQEMIPDIKTQTSVDDKTTVYICSDRVCQPPIIDFDTIQQALNKL